MIEGRAAFHDGCTQTESAPNGSTRNWYSSFSEIIIMTRPEPKELVTEVECPACEGTGFPKVTQLVKPGRKIFPAPCKQCFGKGRLARAAK